MHKYEIRIYWSDEDQVFIAEVPELPGCMTHGETHSAALANADEAIQLWVNTAKEFGNPVPKPSGQRLSISPTRAQHIQPGGKHRATTALSVRRKNKPSTYYDAGNSQPSMNPRAR